MKKALVLTAATAAMLIPFGFADGGTTRSHPMTVHAVAAAAATPVVAAPPAPAPPPVPQPVPGPQPVVQRGAAATSAAPRHATDNKVTLVPPLDETNPTPTTVAPPVDPTPPTTVAPKPGCPTDGTTFAYGTCVVPTGVADGGTQLNPVTGQPDAQPGAPSKIVDMGCGLQVVPAGYVPDFSVAPGGCSPSPQDGQQSTPYSSGTKTGGQPNGHGQ